MSAEAAGLAAQVAASAATGLLMGGSHCLGMCGPLVASFGLSARPGVGAVRAASQQLPYHLGRVATYGLVGAVMGATGTFVNVAGRLAGLGEIVALLAGALMVALGLGAAGVSNLLRQLEAGASRRLMAVFRPLLLKGGPGRLFPLGLALGLLPCGASWTLFLGSAASGGAVPGFLMALAFGLGTLPGLLMPAALGALVGQRERGVLRRVGGVVVAVMGLVFVLRGLGWSGPI